MPARRITRFREASQTISPLKHNPTHAHKTTYYTPSKYSVQVMRSRTDVFNLKTEKKVCKVYAIV